MDPTKQSRAAGLERQLHWLKSGMVVLDRLDRRFFLARLGVLLLGGAATVFGFGLGPQLWGWAALGASLLAFAIVVFFHRRLDRRRRYIQLFMKWTSAQSARLALDWQGIPVHLDLTVDGSHPFARDLDLAGERSLHQLVDTATSRGGSQRLLKWLLHPILEREVIERRQEILRELLLLPGFRTALEMNGEQIQDENEGRWTGETLLKWLRQGEKPPSLVPILVVLFVLGFCNLALYILFAFQILPAFWLISLALYMGLYQWKRREYESLFEDAFSISQSLDGFRQILLFLETYPYPAGGALARLAEPFTQANERPSRHIRKIVWITSAASLNGNPILGLLVNLIVPWNLFFAHLLNRYKTELQKTLPHWLDTWYELEACQSLANFAYLNPNATFPRTRVEGEPLFTARALGHPLIPEDRKVRNDFTLQQLGEVALLTGSNMSGKSTFLRTLGVNLCLAFAGGVVDAAALDTRLFRLFTCIQVSDSLSDGMSYFYSEVRRLKQLLDGLEPGGPHPQFFLIDEIFRGTNNRERQIGSQAYVRALTKGYGAGVISTHDLELARMAGPGLTIINYHFREEIQGQRMVFDYRLRQGPSPTTNALRIMAMEGLPVEQDLPET